MLIGYAGIFIPLLANYIYQNDRISINGNGVFIRLKGLLLGNPSTTKIEILPLAYSPDL